MQLPSSPTYQQAYRGLVALTGTIKEALVRQKEAEEEEKKKKKKQTMMIEAERARQEEQEHEHERRKLILQQEQHHEQQRQQVAQTSRAERAAFQTLLQQVSTRDAIPSIADFEAGLSAFQYANSAEGPEEQDAKLARDDVETALELLKVNVNVDGRDGAKGVSVEDVYAGLTLLGLRTSVRVDEYLEAMEKGGR